LNERFGEGRSGRRKIESLKKEGSLTRGIRYMGAGEDTLKRLMAITGDRKKNTSDG